jgi:Tetratricopeptide repeat
MRPSRNISAPSPTASGSWATHPETLNSRNNLARAYRDAGRLDDAITLHQSTLVARHPATCSLVASGECNCQLPMVSGGA